MKYECCWMALNCQVSLPCNSQCKESHERNFGMAERGETKYPQHHYVLKVAQGETRRRLWLIYLNIKTTTLTKCKDLKKAPGFILVCC